MIHTLELTDTIVITESLVRSGNNIKMELIDSFYVVEEITSAYFIVRTGDTAFTRTNYP